MPRQGSATASNSTTQESPPATTMKQPPNAYRTGSPVETLGLRPAVLKPVFVFRPQTSVYAGDRFAVALVKTGMTPILYAIAIAAPLLAQTPCAENENWGGRDRASHCEIREYTLADTGRLNVDAGTNGGVRVTGADRSNVLVRARVQTNATTPEEAKALSHRDPRCRPRPEPCARTGRGI